MNPTQIVRKRLGEQQAVAFGGGPLLVVSILEGAMKLIVSYEAWWNPQDGKGHFWFTYFDGVREQSVDVDAMSFLVVLDILRGEEPVYGDHRTAAVTTQIEPTGQEAAA